jgi:hypothetical protein
LFHRSGVAALGRDILLVVLGGRLGSVRLLRRPTLLLPVLRLRLLLGLLAVLSGLGRRPGLLGRRLIGHRLLLSVRRRRGLLSVLALALAVLALAGLLLAGLLLAVLLSGLLLAVTRRRGLLSVLALALAVLAGLTLRGGGLLAVLRLAGPAVLRLAGLAVLRLAVLLR